MDMIHVTYGMFFAGDSVGLTVDDLIGGTHIYILARTKISDDREETKAAEDAMIIVAGSAEPYLSMGFDAAKVEVFRQNLIDEVNSGKATLDGLIVLGDAVSWGGLPPQCAQYTSSLNRQG